MQDFLDRRTRASEDCYSMFRSFLNHECFGQVILRIKMVNLQGDSAWRRHLFERIKNTEVKVTDRNFKFKFCVVTTFRQIRVYHHHAYRNESQKKNIARSNSHCNYYVGTMQCSREQIAQHIKACGHWYRKYYGNHPVVRESRIAIIHMFSQHHIILRFGIIVFIEKNAHSGRGTVSQSTKFPDEKTNNS